jgi:hypothetical protein
MTMNTRRTKTLIGAMTAVAIGSAGYAGLMSHTPHPYFAASLLILAALTSRMTVKLPGLNGSMSMNLPFLLAALVNLSAMEAVAIACASTAVQCWPKAGTKVKADRMIFNLSMAAFASSMAALLLHSNLLRSADAVTLAIALAAATMFLGQTLPVATVIALSENKSAAGIWWNLAQLSFPYFVVGAGMSSMMQSVDHRFGWGAALAVFPVMYGIHRSYRMYFAVAPEPVHAAPALTRAAAAGA